MDELEDVLPVRVGLGGNAYRLKNLQKKDARTVILETAKESDLSFEADIVDRILDELEQQPGSENGIFPPHLQIVCTRVAEYVYDRESQEITWQDVEALGGIPKLVTDIKDPCE